MTKWIFFIRFVCHSAWQMSRHAESDITLYTELTSLTLLKTSPPRLDIDIFQFEMEEQRSSQLNGSFIPSLPPPVALTDMDTASPPDREIATCVLARTTPFLCDCHHQHTHRRLL